MLNTSHLIKPDRPDRFHVMADRLRRANAAVQATPEYATEKAARRACDKHRAIYDRVLATKPRSIGEFESKLNVIIEYADHLAVNAGEIDAAILTIDDLRSLTLDLSKITTTLGGYTDV